MKYAHRKDNPRARRGRRDFSGYAHPDKAPRTTGPDDRRSKLGPPAGVFVNVPYQKTKERFVLALLVLVTAREWELLLAAEYTGSAYRLARIRSLIQRSNLDIHEMSPPVRRLNCALELGVSLEAKWERPGQVIVFSTRRLDQQASDLQGIDPSFYDGSGEMAILRLWAKLNKPLPVAALHRIFRKVMRARLPLKRDHRVQTIFDHAVWVELVSLAKGLVAAERKKR